MAKRPAVQPALALFPPNATIEQLQKEAAHCKACDLWKNATQTVFGEGAGAKPKVILVGEQPGDQEDIEGKPFVGPAGKLLDSALVEAGIDRKKVYVTNAVKHFKWEPRGKRRIHKKPNAIEIAACRPWLDAEIAAIRPNVIVCLGATAAQSLLGRDFRVTLHPRRIPKIRSSAIRDGHSPPLLHPARPRRRHPPRRNEALHSRPEKSSPPGLKPGSHDDAFLVMGFSVAQALLFTLRTEGPLRLCNAAHPSDLGIRTISHSMNAIHSPRPRTQPSLLPKLLPMPHARRIVQHAITKLMRQHQNLPAMMRLMRKHVSKHRAAGRPSLRPTPPRKFRNPPFRIRRKSIRQHPQTLPRAFPMCGRSLLHRAPVRIKWRRTPQMRRGIPKPHKPAVVQMREDRRNSAPVASLTRRLSPPSPRIKARENHLVHPIITRIGFEQRIANLNKHRVRLP